MNLVGKTRAEIGELLKERGHDELVDIISSQVALEELFTAPQLARKEKRNVRDVRKDINAGRYVDALFGPGYFNFGGVAKKVSASAANARRRSFFVEINGNRVNGGSNGR